MVQPFQEALLLDVLHHNLFFHLFLCRFLSLLSMSLRLELTLRGALEMPRIIRRGLLDAWCPGASHSRRLLRHVSGITSCPLELLIFLVIRTYTRLSFT